VLHTSAAPYDLPTRFAQPRRSSLLAWGRLNRSSSKRLPTAGDTARAGRLLHEMSALRRPQSCNISPMSAGVAFEPDIAKLPSRTMPALRSFRSSKELRAWMAKEDARARGLLLRIYKKGSGVPSVTYAEALAQALCFGWIDGQKLPFDANSWVQKFTPRRARSGWSKINVARVDRLIQEGQMTPAGLKEVEAAKADGRWATAYDSSANATVPPEFVKELARNAKAKQFYATLNKANRYSIAYRLQTAKRSETKIKRIKAIINMLARGEKFH
jgi:uncharacterized protein YdeI (YjbR/CyaY-like superfamily)